MNCNLNFWSISEFTDFAKFQQELIEYKAKVNELDRIQISQGVDLKKILPILWQEIFQYHKDLNIRFFLNGHFDVQWIADFCELQNITIETWQEIKNPHELSKFKNLKSLNLEANFKQMGNLDFLANINSDIQAMCLSSIEKAPKPDLQILQRFKNLNALYIQNLHKNLDKALTQLPNLTNLTLRSVSQPKNLQCMAGLSKLQSLTLQICSFEDISTIAELKNIRYLQLWRLPKLANLDFISQMQGLQYLFIETLNGVTYFPDIDNLQKLRRVKITSCKNMTDFSNVAHSQSIVDFAIQNAKQSDLDVFIPILTNRSIQRIGIGYEKVATQKEVLALAKKHGRKHISVYMYPDFEEFVFE